MNQPVVSIEELDEKQLLSLISTVEKWLVFMGPGVSKAIAEAIVECWHRLGRRNVKVVLDVDPEVARMGYGDVDGLNVLQNAASEFGMVINRQRGVRIGVLITDLSTHVFAPTPLLIEAGSTNSPHFNSVSLDFVPPNLVRDLGLGEKGSAVQSVGREEISSEKIAKVAQDLQKNPPVKFDIARKMRVFNTFFEFVEFELKGTQLTRRQVPIPSDLMGLAQNKQTQQLLHANFRLISSDGPLSDRNVKQIKDFIVSKYLTSLPNYGSVILRTKKDEFIKAVNVLEKYVSRYQRRIEQFLQTEMDKNRAALMAALLPAVMLHPPKRWLRSLISDKPTEQEAVQMLNVDLEKAFGTANNLISKMQVRVIFKGVTYELLKDPKFVATAQKALPTLDVLHEEFSVAQGKKDI